jgi:hypothetical protein
MSSRKAEMPRGKGLSRATGLARTSGLNRAVPMQASRKDSIPLAVRKLVYKRDAWCCVRCGLFVMGEPHNVHHRIRRSQLGPDSPENLILLCGSGNTTGCHGWVHGHVKDAQEHGWLLESGSDPAAKGVAYATEDGGFAVWYLLPDGDRHSEPPSEVAA